MKSEDRKPEPGGEKKKIRAPAKKPAEKKPAEKKPAAKKPAPKKPAVKKPAAKKAAPRKKAVRTRQTIENVTSEKNLTLIRGWCMDGATNAEIAALLKISETTFYRYVQKSEVLRQALAETKEVVDRKVENALLKSAIGFTGPDGKYYPPNITAQIFWLKNRKPRDWRQKVEDVQGEDDGTGLLMMPAVVEDVMDEETAEGEEK